MTPHIKCGAKHSVDSKKYSGRWCFHLRLDKNSVKDRKNQMEKREKSPQHRTGG